MSELNPFLDSVETRLSQAGFHTARDLRLPRYATVQVAASRTVFTWKGLVLLSQHVLVRHCPTATISDLQAFFDAGYRYGMSANPVPLKRGIQFGYVIMPCLVVESCDPTLIQYACARPRKHWALFEFPVVHDLSTRRTHYFRQTPLWGAVYYSDMRKLAETCISTESPSAR
jgi:hypothetical protein